MASTTTRNKAKCDICDAPEGKAHREVELPVEGRKKCPVCRKMKSVTSFPTKARGEHVTRDYRACRPCVAIKAAPYQRAG